MLRGPLLGWEATEASVAACMGTTSWYSLWFSRVGLLPSRMQSGLPELTFI